MSKEVFCKDCVYWKGEFVCQISGYEGYGKGLDSITGDQDDITCDCRIKNINRNCPDWEQEDTND